ncbi:MAG: hypothetical protein AB8B79_04395 [Granulosicoccus sp.]
MRYIKPVVVIIASALLLGCATGKSIKSAEDIQDDGKSNVVLITHDIAVYVTDKHSSVKKAKLAFRCPKGKDLLKVNCFDVVLPYLGTKTVDGFGLHAFEISGAKAIKMKYDNYALRSVVHNVVIDRIPKTSCYYNKKTKKDECTTRLENKSDTHRAGFPSPITFNVAPGSGCYLGHLSMSVVNSEMRDFSLDTDTPLTADKLSDLAPDVAAKLLETASQSC